MIFGVIEYCERGSLRVKDFAGLLPPPNYKISSKEENLHLHVSGPHAAAMDWAKGGRVSSSLLSPLQPSSGAPPAAISLNGSQQPKDEVRCKQETVQAELFPNSNSQYLYCVP